MSLFCVLSFAQVVPAFAVVAGFYLLSRSMAAMQIIAGAALQDPTLTDRVVNAVVELIALLLPALDGMTQTTWLLGSDRAVSTLGPVVGQTALLPRADLFRGAFRLVPQELLRRCHNDRLQQYRAAFSRCSLWGSPRRSR